MKTNALLVAAVAAFSSPALAAPDAATDSAGRILIDWRPAPEMRYIHSSSSKSRTSVKQPNQKESHTVADVLTNIILIETGPREFDGTQPLSILLRDSHAQAFTQMLRPLQRESPLKDYAGIRAELNLRPDGTLKLSDADVKGKPIKPALQTLYSMAKNVLYPFPPARKHLAVGESWEASEFRRLPVQRALVDVEVLRKITVANITPGTIDFKTDIVVRPRYPDQGQAMFGRGSGTWTLSRVFGVFIHANEKLVTESKVLGPKGWLLFKSDTETELVTEPEPLKK
ncbi:MAG: hypothetical protein D6761_01445 [Candidatus Dadabacteria bacterium]|nr:MAG: hypothetical protein D6761_01445 [Candidatus Dadabacteria bacterium]